MPLIIGLSGKRGVGKSEIAKILHSAGWRTAHAFGPGKAAVSAYYRHIGYDARTAYEMTHGTLKDEPTTLLPGGVSSRYFMERLGNWMATNPELGTPWTLGVELNRMIRCDPKTPIVIESVVYETPIIHQLSGFVVRVTRSEHVGPVGEKTDAHESTVPADAEFLNPDTGLENLKAAVISFFEPAALVERCNRALSKSLV